MLQVKTIINNPVSSNCFIITMDNSNSCIIVDPGTEDCKELISYLKNNNLNPDYIILSHEHVDHIIGCQELKKFYDVKIVCSLNCSKYMQLSKYNLTRMTEQWEERLSMPEADVILEDKDYHLEWEDSIFNFYKTEGHSYGSICFSIGDIFFAGDTLIKGYRTTTILPGASREDLITTFEFILNQFDLNKTFVYSGHYDGFYLKEVEQEVLDQIIFLKKKIKQKKG